MVVQAATNVTIVTIPDKLEVDQWGGMYQFDVDANTRDWQIESDADWVKVTPKQFKGEVVVQIDENTLREARTAKLTLKGGSTAKEFIISQDGVIFFVLPYLGFGDDSKTIKNFELARKSELTEKPDGLFNTNFWGYDMKSAAFTFIRYILPLNVYKEAYAFPVKGLFNTEMDNFKKYLKDNGFEDQGNNVFLHKAKSIQASIMDKAESPHVHYKYIPKQPQGYKTFDAFPYGLVDFTADKEKVLAYEKDNGGKFVSEKSNEDPAKATHYLYFDVSKDKLFSRAYIMDNAAGKPKLLLATNQFYTDMNLVFWDYNGELLFTEEFTKLMEKEGFTYTGLSSQKSHIFRNPTKKVIAFIKWAKYADMEIPVLSIQIQPIKETASVDYVKRELPYTKM